MPRNADNWQAVHDLLYGRVAVVGECWEWTGYRMPAGHGQIKRKGMRGPMLVHRYVWSKLVGPIPDCVLHRCDNPPCVRPSHLWLGSQSDNSKDMWAKGRGSKPPMNWDGIHCAKGHLLELGNVYLDPKTGARRCHTCMNGKSLRWYRQNRERAKENKRRWNEANREHIRAYSRRAYAARKERT